MQKQLALVCLSPATYPYSPHDVRYADLITDFLVVADQSDWIITLTINVVNARHVVHIRTVLFL